MKTETETKVLICKKCGCSHYAKAAVIHTCELCGGTEFLETELTVAEVEKAKKKCQWNDILRSLFYEDQVMKMTKYANDLRIEHQEKEGRGNHITESTIEAAHDNCVPSCPTCHSTDIKRIGNGEKAVSILLWGLFSGKRDKTFICNKCGYKW